ncbi:hypothetical protein L7F22_019784 [Adiantum nelumboides]|nr:hypothetical protein [Adiantum nelumboides]
MTFRHHRRRIVIHLALLFTLLLCVQNSLALFDPGEADQAEVDQTLTDQSVSQPISTNSRPIESESNDERELRGTSPATYVMLDEATPPPPDQLAEAVQAKEYDAWRERIGGEDSELWLSFDQWRENYLATEREKAEQEKQRLAASRRNRSEKQKDTAAKANHDQSAMQVNNTEINAQNGGPSSPIQLSERPAETHTENDSTDSPTESGSSSLDESQNAKGNAEAKHEQGTPNGDIIPTDSTALPDQISIPALGNPTDELANLKQRWNFASLDCAAVVHRSNPGAKFTSSILSEKKDRYMLSPCPSNPSDSQFVVVELCEEIKIDTLVLANFEFFSRMFKRFNVRVSRNLNGGEDEWVDIGTFRAVMFEDCKYSKRSIHLMDDYVREEEELRKAREAETLLLQESEEGEQVNEEVVDGKQEQFSEDKEESTVVQLDPESSSSHSDPEQSTYQPSPSISSKEETVVHSATQAQRPIQTVTGVSDRRTTSTGTLPDQIVVPTAINSPSNQDNRKYCAIRHRDAFDVWRLQFCEKIDEQKGSTSLIGTDGGSEKARKTSETVSNKSRDKIQPSASNQAPPAPSSPNSSSSSTQISSSSVQHQPSQQSPQNQQQQQQQQHGGSESIYRTITKRLNMLEMNATLSLQYMDHSRHMLRETFGRMERTQQEKIGQMLGELNASNWQQIENLKRRQQMDLQQALFEFDLHRQQTDAERRALLAQVHLLSNEIMLEKRFGIAQLALLLGLFVFMGLTRGSRAAAPLINQGISRLSRSSSFVPKHGHSFRNGRRQLHEPGRTMSMQSNSSSSSTLQSGPHTKAFKRREDNYERDHPKFAVSHKSPRSSYARSFRIVRVIPQDIV